MPAVTVDDLSVLPKVTAPAPGAEQRRVQSITTAPRGFEGEGFPVHRAFAGVDLALLDPFVHMDQMGEVEYAPGEPKGTPWHPHRGFETVTYMLDGVFDHHDSFGGGGTITNGDTQWMTAGAGILHIEKPPEWLVASGGLFHGIQLWVNLPKAQKMIAPRYQDLRAGSVGLLTTPDSGALIRVIAGQVDEVSGPGSTYTPMSLVHATVSPGAAMRIPWRRDFNALVYVLAGSGTVGPERRPISAGQLAVLGAGDEVRVHADERQESRYPSLEVLVLGGRPIREPVAWGGPFVMNTRAEVVAAFEDFQAGRLGSIPSVHGLGSDITTSN
jgi:redox-sensitive bicupin YhaK (pirin superfamily)